MEATTTGGQAADQMQTSWASAAQRAEQDAAGSQPQAGSQPLAPGAPQAGAGGTASMTAPQPGPVPPASPAAMPAPEPPVVTSTKPGGIRGLLQSIGDALTGKSTPELGTDAQGNTYVKQTALTGAQRWARIAADAAVGAAKGFAAGRGGNAGAAVGAGVDQGMKFAQQREQQQTDMTQAARQQNLDRANNQLLTQKIAEQAMAMKRLGVQGTQEAIKFSEDQQDWMAAHSEGGQPIEYLDQDGKPTSTVGNVKDAAQMMIQTPGFHADHIQNGLMQPVQLYDADGKAAGFAVYKMKAGSGEDMLPAGTTVYHYDGIADKLVPQQTSQPMKATDVFATNNAAAAAMNKAHLDAADLAAKRAETDPNSPENKLKNAQTGEASSAAAKNRAEAANAQAEGGGAPVGSLASYPAPVQNTVRGLTDYTVDPNTFPNRKYAKSGQLDRETAIGLAKQIDPSYDEKQYGSRHALLKDFTSGKAAANIRSLNTAIGHLDRMATSGSALGNTSNQGINAIKNTVGPWFGATAQRQYHTDVNAVAGELSTLFKGTGATDTEIKNWKDGMSDAQTPAQIKTGIDEALQLMNGRYDALDSQYTTGMGRAKDFQMLSPQSREILQRLGATELLQKEPQAQNAPTPRSFSPSAWAAANPGKDVTAAIAAAKQQGYQVTQ